VDAGGVLRTFGHHVVNPSGHDSQGDVKGVEAVAPAGDEVEHRSPSEQVDGLTPDTAYQVLLSIDLASNTPEGRMGIGG